ncbi:MAG: peptidoglycan DD-metalloendopeptidase family protein [bacterium]
MGLINKKSKKNINNNLNSDSTVLNFEDINNLEDNSNNINNKKKSGIMGNLRLLFGFQKNKGYAFMFILGSLLIALSSFHFLTVANAQTIYLNDTLIGSISGVDNLIEGDLDGIIENMIVKQTGLPVEINGDITFEITRVNKNDFTTQDKILENIASIIEYKVEASSIYVNDKFIATVKSKEEAEDALNRIKKSYTIEGIVTTQEPTFVENIEIRNELVLEEDIIDSDSAFNLLNIDQIEQKTHTIVSGDTLYAIALDNDLTLKEVLDANPQITADTTLKLDSIINLVVPMPLISVMTYEQTTYEVVIAKDVISIPNDDEYKTFSNVLVEGSNGSKEITTNITKVNGITHSEEIVKEVVLIEAVAKQIEVGTLEELPKKALGSFVYPVSGARLSSGYGMRWGSLHKGIDLACNANTPIRASDGGIVTFSGWNSGGYGYMVKIDHENGFETLYAHNSKNAVTVGQRVAQGEIIAYVGSTGDSTGNHVHFEILKNGTAQNPLNYI